MLCSPACRQACGFQILCQVHVKLNLLIISKISQAKMKNLILIKLTTGKE